MAAPRGSDIRRHILESTAALMEGQPFPQISLSDIARAADISKGTLYYYYASKDAILFDIADRYLTRMSDELLDWVNNKEKDTSLPRLLSYVLSYGVFDPAGNMRLYLIAEAVSGRADLRERLLARYEHFKSILVEKISERRPGTDGTHLAWLVLMVMDGMLVQNQLHNEDLDLHRFIEQTVSELTEG